MKDDEAPPPEEDKIFREMVAKSLEKQGDEGKRMNAKIKPFNKSTKQCPFCSDPDFLAPFTEGKAKKVMIPLPLQRRQEKFWHPSVSSKGAESQAHIEAEKRDQFLRIVFDQENFKERWADFKIEDFGIESVGAPFLPRDEERVIINPPGPFFFLYSSFPRLGRGDETAHYGQFFACRITHKDSDLSIIVHWWPTHGRLIDIHGSLSPFPVNSDLNVIKDALSFFQTETRGASAKFSEEVVSDVLRRLGANITQKAAADELQVTERTLERWRARHGMVTWKEVVNRYGVADRKNA